MINSKRSSLSVKSKLVKAIFAQLAKISPTEPNFFIVCVNKNFKTNSGEHFRTGDLSKVNCSSVHKGRFVSCGKVTTKALCQIMIGEKGCTIHSKSDLRDRNASSCILVRLLQEGIV